MDDRDISILTQVAFKAAVEVFNSGETETDDFTGEVQALTQAGFKVLITEVTRNIDENVGGSGNSGKSSRRTKKSAGGSKKRGSKSSGNTKPKDPDADISKAQLNLLKRLLGDAEIEYDDESFDWDGDDIFFEDLTMGTVQEYFDELK